MPDTAALPLRQSLSLWERWHGASRDGEGEDAAMQTLSVSHSLDSSPEGRAFYPSAALRAAALFKSRCE